MIIHMIAIIFFLIKLIADYTRGMVDFGDLAVAFIVINCAGLIMSKMNER